MGSKSENDEVNEVITELLAILDFHIASLQETKDIHELDELRQCVRRRMREEGAGSRLRYLLKVFNLTEFEGFCLIVALAAEVNGRYGETFASIQGNENLQYPTKNLVIHLYRVLYPLSEEDTEGFLDDEYSLGKYCLNIGENRGTGYDILLPDSNVRNYLLHEGCDFCPRMDHLHVYKPSAQLSPGLIHRDIAGNIRNLLTGEADESMMIHLCGKAGIGKHFLIKKAVEEQMPGKKIFFYDLSGLPGMPVKEQKGALDKLIGYTALADAVLCLELRELPEESACRRELGKWLAAACGQEGEVTLPHIFLLTESEPTELLTGCKNIISFNLSNPGIAEKEALWNEFSRSFPIAEDLRISDQSGKYILTPAEIRNVLHTALLYARAQGGSDITRKDILLALQERQPRELGSYAEPIRGVFTWSDLILEDKQKKVLQLICNQVKYRQTVEEEWGFAEGMPYGRGVSVLFYGAPGTGKTMAAQVLANELGFSLYRIDLSRLISKYIGETEKNISELFKRAQGINAILFFDEADALFAKRSEIRDSNDRSANSMTAHLLQKLEDYEGITVLATNLLHNMDDAFKRRIKFMVQFTMPGPAARLKLFQSILPAGAACGETLDLNFFAEHFELSGSSIKEILLNAAYMAAAEQGGIRNCHLVEAVRLNYLKYGKVLTNRDFGYLA